LAFYFGMGTSEPKILEFYENVGIQISKGEVIVFSRPLSIKTVTRGRLGGVKLIWTVQILAELKSHLLP
jgi:hypothetical protein